MVIFRDYGCLVDVATPCEGMLMRKLESMSLSKTSKVLLTIAVVIAFIGVFLALMPKPIDMDLNKLGNGQKSVVFVYDPNLVLSNTQATEINKARDIVGEEVNFLIAKTGDPDGEAFKQRFQARSTDLLFFNGNGELVDRQSAVLSAETLVGALASQ